MLYIMDGCMLNATNDHDLYSIATNEYVIKIQDTMTSPGHRTKVKISCVLFWTSFTFLLAAIQSKYHPMCSFMVFQTSYLCNMFGTATNRRICRWNFSLLILYPITFFIILHQKPSICS